MAKNEPKLERTSGSLFKDDWTNKIDENEEFESKRLSIWAVVSVVLAVPALMAMVHQAFLVFSVAAIVASLAAFYAIGRSGGELVGSRLAGAALAVAIAMAIAAPLDDYVFKQDFSRQANAFAQHWFECVKSDNPALARQLTEPRWRRAPFVTKDDEISYWARSMSGDEEPHNSVHSYLCNPTLLTIHAAGDRAKMTYYGTINDFFYQTKEETSRIYAVTIEPENPNGKRQTFFVNLMMERIKRIDEETGQVDCGWTLSAADVSPMKLVDGRPVKK